MAYADSIRNLTCNMNDVASLIEGIWSSSYGLTWSSWTPTYGAGGSGTFTSVTTHNAKYIQCGKCVILSIEATGTVGGTPNHFITFSLPVSYAATASKGTAVLNNSGWSEGGIGVNTGDFVGGCDKYNLATLATGSLYFNGTLIYEVP